MTTGQLTSLPTGTIDTSHREPSGCRRVLLVTVARGDARFCIRLGDVSEVGRVARLTRMDGPHDSVLGSMVLHGETVPVIDVATAIGAVREPDDDPKMFAATRTQPVACIAFDRIVGKHKGEEKGAGKHPHKLILGLIAARRRSLPLIDVPAVVRMAQGATFATEEAGAAVEIASENPL